MCSLRHRRLFLLLTLLIMVSGTLLSQTVTDPEAEFARIRSVAFDGRYQEAELAARNLLSQYPEYGDARILLGRVIAWQGRYDEAAAVIDTLLAADPGNSDALSALSDIRRWSRDRSQQATPATDIRAGYLIDTYRQPRERVWQVFSLGAGHRFSWGTAVASVNIGDVRLGPPATVRDNDLQFAAEAWPELGKKNYAYLAYAYSDGPWFPKHRAAAEIWQSLPYGWEISAGLNYYYFDRNIFIATASVEKYLQNWWLAGRGYFHFKDIGVTTSLYLTARRYFRTVDYLQLTVGTGTAPDEPWDVMTDLERQKATSARLTWFSRINPYWAYRIGAGYSYENWDAGSYRSRFEATAGIIRGIGRLK